MNVKKYDIPFMAQIFTWISFREFNLMKLLNALLYRICCLKIKERRKRKKRNLARNYFLLYGEKLSRGESFAREKKNAKF